jgi:hypothetical protein
MAYELKGRAQNGKKAKAEVFPDGKQVTREAELRAAKTAVRIPLLGTD